MRDAKERMINAAIEVMQLPSGTKLKAKSLSMAASLEWCERAEKVEKAIESSSTDRARLAEAMGLVLDLICDYDETWPREQIQAEATSAQLLDAFYLLWRENDPLAIAERNKVEAVERQLGMVEKVANIKSLAEMKRGEI